MREPRKGERYRSQRPLPVIVMTHWAAPCTGGTDAIFPAGEAFVIANDAPEGATAVYCDPVRYERLHERFVPAEKRADPLYGGYYLCIDIDFIMNRCKRVGTADRD